MSLQAKVLRLERYRHGQWLRCPRCDGRGPVQFITPQLLGPDGTYLTADPPDPPPIPPCAVCGRPPFVIRFVTPRLVFDPAIVDLRNTECSRWNHAE